MRAGCGEAVDNGWDFGDCFGVSDLREETGKVLLGSSIAMLRFGEVGRLFVGDMLGDVNRSEGDCVVHVVSLVVHYGSGKLFDSCGARFPTRAMSHLLESRSANTFPFPGIHLGASSILAALQS